MKNFSDLTQQELLALAIALEEEDSRTYSDLAEAMRETYPGTARMFAAMAEEEDGHRHRLLDLYREKFGDHIPLIRRQDVKGFIERKSLWLARPLGLEKVRAQAELMEAETQALLPGGGAARDRRRHPSAPRRPRGGRAPPRSPGGGARGAIRAGRGREGGGRIRAAALPFADRAARSRRADGRFGLDLGAALCRRLRNAADLANLSRWPCGRDRRRDLDGVRRSIVRQRLVDRARQPLGPRPRLRRDDRRSAGSGTPCRSWCPPLRSRSRSPPRSWSSNSQRSRGSATATWTRRCCRPAFQVVVGGLLVFATGVAIGSG